MAMRSRGRMANLRSEPRDDPPVERPMRCEHGVPMSVDCDECWADAEWGDDNPPEEE